jgi:hypothetical protein
VLPLIVLVCSAPLAPACSSSGDASPMAQAPDGGSSAAASAFFDPDARFDAENGFFDFPWPSDLRLTPDGAPDVAAFPNPGVPILDGVKLGVPQRKGYAMIGAAYFKLTAKPKPRAPEDVVRGGAKAPILLVDVDPASPERGALLPVVAQTPNPDPYVPENLLAVGARPGIVLAPKRKYAFVVTTAVGFEGDPKVEPPKTLAALARGEAPSGPKGEALKLLYAPMFETLDTIGVARADVLSATVFTTGDVVQDNADLGDKVLAKHSPDLTDFALEPDPTNRLPYICHVRAKIVLPQFQRGKPIYDTEGLFELEADGTPKKQRDETVPVSIAIPKKPMPAGGYPLVLYFHGSGGVSRQLVDGGDQGDPPDRWPGSVLATHGFATAGQALPISPERVPGAQDIDYVNVDNLIATRDTFRQGILESRMLLSALLRARIPAGVLAGCAGPSLPDGETAYRFADAPHAQGQSMGGMYTNLVSASEKRIQLAVPTGAGGYWTYFILYTKAVPGVAGLVSVLLKTPEKLTFLHPALMMAETALEPTDPMVSAARVGRRPLPGHPARPIYEPVGKDDSYFATVVYDAMDLAYRHPRAGDEAWTSMREAQSLVGLDQPIPYPVKANLTSVDGAKYTGVVVQYAGDGTFDTHGIYRRLDAVMHQYGCFHETFRKNRVAVVPAPAPLGTPCAE